MSRSPTGQDVGGWTLRVLLAWAVTLYAVAVAMAPLVWHRQGPAPADPIDRWGRHLFGADLTRVLADLQLRGAADRLCARTVTLGQPREVVVMVVVLGLVSVVRRDWLGTTLCALGPGCAVVLTEYAAKPLVHRVRDGVYQYPSGHCTGAAAIGTLGVLLLHRYGGRRALRRWGCCFIIPPGLVFISVLRLRWHDLTEAIAGEAVGMGTVLLVAMALTAVADVRRRRVAPDLRTAP